jgi:uncharacterized protein CbrC (UPF0167 family)
MKSPIPYFVLTRQKIAVCDITSKASKTALRKMFSRVEVSVVCSLCPWCVQCSSRAARQIRASQKAEKIVPVAFREEMNPVL